MPTSSMMRRPPTPSTIFSFFSVWGGRAMRWILTPRVRGADQPLDDDGILVALVLDKQRVLRVVNELRDALAPVGRAPDQVRVSGPA